MTYHKIFKIVIYDFFEIKRNDYCEKIVRNKFIEILKTLNMLIHLYIDWVLIYYEFLTNFVCDFNKFEKINDHERVVFNKFNNIKLKIFNTYTRLNIECSLTYHNSIKIFERIKNDLRSINLNSIVSRY